MSFNGHRAAATATRVQLVAVPEPPCVVSLVLHPSEPCAIPSPLPVPIAPPKLSVSEHVPKAMMDFIGFLALCLPGEERKAVKPVLMYCVIFGFG